MSLNKKTMVREIGRRTRLSNRDVERVIEALVEVWTEELVSGGRIEMNISSSLMCRRLNGLPIVRCQSNGFARLLYVQVKHCVDG